MKVRNLNWKKLGAISILINILLISTLTYVIFASSNGTFTISKGVYPGSPSYTIWKEGSTYYAKDAYGVIPSWGSGKDASTVIQSALDALTSGRTVKEKVTLKGTFIINTVLDIPSYTVLDLSEAYLKLGDGKNQHILKVYNKVHVDILGGILDGNKANQISDVYGMYIFGSSECRFINQKILNTYSDAIHITFGGRNIIAYPYIYQPRGDGIEINNEIYDDIIAPEIRGSKGEALDFEASDHVNVLGGTLLGDANSEFNGITIEESKYINLFGTHVRLFPQHGVLIQGSSYNTLKNLIVKDNSQKANNTYDGIRLADYAGTPSTYNKILGTTIRSTKTNKHRWSIIESGAGDFNIIQKNTVLESVSGQISWVGTNTIVKHNIGFVTENSGTFSSISNGTYVLHGLAGRPSIVSITLSVPGYAWYGTLNSTHIQIYANVATISGSWYAEYKP